MAGIIITNQVSERNDALIRTAISSADVQNGEIFSLTRSVGDFATWDVNTPAVATLADAIWIANDCQAPVATDANGQQYRVDGIKDPSAWINLADRPFDARKLVKGDIITLNADAVGGAQAAFAVATDGEKFVQFAAAGITTGLSLKFLEVIQVPLPSATIGNTVDMYKFEVENA